MDQLNKKDKRFPDSRQVYRQDVKANELDEEISGISVGEEGEIKSKLEATAAPFKSLEPKGKRG